MFVKHNKSALCHTLSTPTPTHTSYFVTSHLLLDAEVVKGMNPLDRNPIPCVEECPPVTSRKALKAILKASNLADVGAFLWCAPLHYTGYVSNAVHHLPLELALQEVEAQVGHKLCMAEKHEVKLHTVMEANHHPPHKVGHYIPGNIII